MRKGVAVTTISIVLVLTVICTTLFVKHRLEIAAQTEKANLESTEKAADTANPEIEGQTSVNGTINTESTDNTKNSENQSTDNAQNTDSTNESTSSQTVTQIVPQNPQTPQSTQPEVLANWWDYPSEILPTTKSGDDLLVLVNKKYALPASYAPSDLVAASNSGFPVTSAIQLRSILIDELVKMHGDSVAAGISLTIASGYRSYSNQEYTYKYWRDSYFGGNANEADKISARAGHSQHQLGTAIDFSTPIGPVNNRIGAVFNGSAAQLWLAENAWKYGFALSYPEGAEPTTGYSYESWHYRFIGVENAKALHDSGELLELWLSEN